MWRWIVYGALGLWLSGALFDLVLGSLRVLSSSKKHGRPLRSTPSYFINGVYGLLAFGTLAWFFYWNYVGEFWTIALGGIASLPEILYVTWRIKTAPTALQSDLVVSID